jgi:hypothetical protein
VRNKRNIVVDIKVGYTIKGFVEKNQISHLSIITQKYYQILPKSCRKITKNGKKYFIKGFTKVLFDEN